jgi:AcrR family transcriptional regulator
MGERSDIAGKRRRMAPEDRREAILDAAQALFTARGWEAVTIADVLAAAGISKGGFYHHFASKEDLLTGIVLRMTVQGLDAAEAARRRAGGDALARLNAFLRGAMRWKARNSGTIRFVADAMSKPGNDLLYLRMMEATAKAVRPVMQGLIAEGVAQGRFDVVDPDLTAELILAMTQGQKRALEEALAATGGDVASAADLLEARTRAEGAICDRLLGLPRGSVQLSHSDDFRQMLARLCA